MSIYVKTYIVENEEKRVFIVHGINEHSGRYQDFAQFLNKHKISVITYDLRGHGKSGGKPAYIKYFTDHVNDLKEVIIKHNNPKAKQYLLGHSMGGLIGHLYMIDNPLVDGYIVSGAPTDYLPDVKPFKFIGYRWLGFIKMKNNLANDTLSHDKEVEKAYLEDPLVGKYFYIRLVGEMFIRGVKHLNKYIYKNNKPILILHGEDDKIVPKQFSERIYNLIAHDNKQLKIYDKMYHEILNEIEKKQVYNDILRWLNDQ